MYICAYNWFIICQKRFLPYIVLCNFISINNIEKRWVPHNQVYLKVRKYTTLDNELAFETASSITLLRKNQNVPMFEINISHICFICYSLFLWFWFLFHLRIFISTFQKKRHFYEIWGPLKTFICIFVNQFNGSLKLYYWFSQNIILLVHYW